MKVQRFVGAVALVVLISACFVPAASAQYSATGDVLFASKYVWRGYRVTDEPVLQPAMTLGIGGFAFNAWGNLDLTDINGQEGDFSEIDYTFSYDQGFEGGSVGGGVIFYTFPGAPTTTEIYGGVSFDVIGAPSVTLYVDVDETRAGGGDPGLYVLLGGGHSFPTSSDVVPSIDVSGSFAFANDGFTGFYAGVGGGTHDASVGVSVPFVIDDNWSASGFVTYSGLVGDDLRGAFSEPDSVVGGASISLSF